MTDVVPKGKITWFTPPGSGQVQAPTNTQGNGKLFPQATINGINVVNTGDKRQEILLENRTKNQADLEKLNSQIQIDVNKQNALDSSTAMSGEQAKLFTIAVEAIPGIVEFKNKINNGSLLIAPSILDRDLDSLNKNLADSLGRLRSGGVIGKEELPVFMNLLPTALDTTAIKLNKLTRLESMFNTLGKNISTPQRFKSAVEDSMNFRGIKKDVPKNVSDKNNLDQFKTREQLDAEIKKQYKRIYGE